MFPTRCLVAILVALAFFACPSCKREEAAVPTLRKPPAIPGPTSQDALEEQRAKLIASLVPLPPLGVGVSGETPDGEFWVRYPSGLMIHQLKPADGPKPRWGQTVAISYIGTLPGQTKPFDQRSADHPLTFRLGTKDIVTGMSMGVASMNVGAKSRFFLPPDLAYGVMGKPESNIDMNQALIFEVELLSVSGEAVEEPKIEPAATLPTAEEMGPMAPAKPEAAPAPATAPAN